MMRTKMFFTSGLALTLLTLLLLSGCAGDPQKGKVKYLQSGIGHMQKGKYQEAAIQFRNALKLDPRFVDAYYQLAQANLALHQWNDAYTALQHAIALDPARLDARLDRGRLALAARNYKDAQEEASFMLAKDATNAAAYQLLGASLLGQQQNAEALKAFSRITELMPHDSSSFINLALVELSLGHVENAEQHFQKAVVVDPQSVQAYADLANFYRLQGKNPEAGKVLQAGIERNPRAAGLYVVWADLLYNQQRANDAETLLTQLRQQSSGTDVSLAIGDFYFQRGQTDQALSEYRRGLSISADNLEIKKRIEDLYLVTGQLRPASDLDKELLQKKLKDPSVRINHGRMLMAQGKFDEAIAELQRDVKDSSDSAPAHYFLGSAYWQKGNTEQAKSEMEEAVRLAPDLPIARDSLIKLHLQAGDLAVAQEYAERGVQMHPADESERLLLGWVYLRQRKLDKAREQFLAARQLKPDDFEVALSLAQTFAAEHKWVEAEMGFENALQLRPRDMRALGMLVDFWFARKQPEKAIARAMKLTAAYPEDANGHLILGSIYLQTNNYVLAQAELERSVQLDPGQAQAYLQLGRMYEAQQQTENAIKKYEQALVLQPKFAPLQTLVGNLYLAEGRLEEARRHYEQAVAIDPNFGIAASNLAWVYVQQGGNLDVALGLAQKAKEMMPEAVSINDTLAWVMYKKGIFQNALPLLQECVAREPGSAQFHYHLGMALLATGDKGKAKSELQTALRLNLDHAFAGDARQALDHIN